MKKKLLIIIFVLLFAAPFSSYGATPIGLDWATIEGFGLPDPGDNGVYLVLDNFLKWLLSIFGMIAIIAFIISGIQYLMSSGDDKMIETAKRNMKWSIIGVITALSGFVILQAIDLALKASTTVF